MARLDHLAARSPSFMVVQDALFEAGGETYVLPRYLFIGPTGGGEPMRIGLFAGIHGDEPEGVNGLVHFLETLERNPGVAKGYCLFLYPVCNPTGFEDGTRHARSGKDLNREFWTGSSQPEVQLLEAELTAYGFEGLISLHTDDTSDGFYGYVGGATLTEHLIEPALRAAERFLPRNTHELIDGFQARNGVIRDCFQGVLRAPPSASPRPFEIILETQKAVPEPLKTAAFVEALQTILTRYREFIAFAPNL